MVNGKKQTRRPTRPRRARQARIPPFGIPGSRARPRRARIITRRVPSRLTTTVRQRLAGRRRRTNGRARFGSGRGLI